MAIKRLPEVRSLWEILPKGTEGGKEFARIVDLLRFHEGRRTGKQVTIFSDVAGDYHGLDGWKRAPLLVDANLWVLEVYETAVESPLQQLAGLTRGSTFSAIRIAQCIRGISLTGTHHAWLNCGK